MANTPAQRSIHLGGGHRIDVRWTAVDRAIESIAPAWAANRLRARVGHAITASAGSWTGADRTRRSLVGWNPISGDADADSLADLQTMRDRSEDLVRNSPIAGGAIDTISTHVIGTGLSLQANIDAKALGLTDDQAAAWHAEVERKFNAWWESTDCDITRTQNGYGLQNLALRAELVRGDGFAVLTRAPWARGPITLALQFIEADRCSNPDRKPDTPTLVAGVQMDENGAPLGYHFASRHPTRVRGGAAIRWQYVPAFGSRTGRRNVLHLFDRNRIGLTRGIPCLAPVIEPLKQLERYTEAELMAAVVSGMFTVFIKTEGSSTIMPGAFGAATAGAAGGSDVGLGNGSIVELGQNESIDTANPGRPNAQFAPFIDAIVTQVGMRLGMPKEVLMKVYTSSYTAAQAAFLDAWRTFRTRRDRHAMYFCQPIYQAWLDEAVAVGHIAAPGYFADPLIRRAWQGAQWIGDGPGAIRPDIAVESATKRVESGISTLESESVLHDGVKWSAKFPQLLREARQMAQLRRLRGDATATAPAATPGTEDSTDPGADQQPTDPQQATPAGTRPQGAPTIA